jgi:hypothetical protein
VGKEGVGKVLDWSYQKFSFLLDIVKEKSPVKI